MTRYTLYLLIALNLCLTTQAPAQSAGGHDPATTAGILSSLPPDLYKKLERLSQLLDQHIKAGKLTDEQIQQELMSGRLEQTLRSLGPEANQLMDEISTDMKNGKGPGEDALAPLLEGLSGIRE